MSEAQDFERQAREAVAAALVKQPATAVDVIGQQISRASRVGPDPRAAVVAACRGGMGALLLGGQDLAAASVQLLESLANMTLISRVGPEDLMTWVMEGIAAVMPLASPAVENAIKSRIDEKFMGAGEIFGSLVSAARRKA